MSLESVGTINSEEFEFKWKVKLDVIQSFNKSKSHEDLYSPVFTTYSFGKAIKWCLFLQIPSDLEDTEEYSLSIFLKNKSIFEVEATFSFFLLDKLSNKLHQNHLVNKLFKKPKDSWERDYFLQESSLTNRRSNFLVDGEVTIGVQITINRILNQDQKTFNAFSIMDDYEKLLLDEKFSDFTVISADERKLQVNRGILIRRSPVFKAMFEHDTVESEESTVSIPDFDYDVLLEMFRFIYSGKVNDTSTLVCDLLRAAEKYSIEDLKLVCEESMMVSLSETNAIEYLIASDLNGSSNLPKICEYIVKKSKDFVNTPEFKSLMVSHPELTHKIMMGIVYGNARA